MSQPSNPNLTAARSPQSSLSQQIQRLVAVLLVAILSILLTLFLTGQLVILGVPSAILVTFLQDRPALAAFVQGNKQALHDRLGQLGIEERIKEFYRPEIPDEQELDRYIHQLFYDRTGYVGEAYQLNEAGQLILRSKS